MSIQMTDMFQEFNQHLEKEQEIRNNIRDIVKLIDMESKEVLSNMQIIHTDISAISKACGSARLSFEKCIPLYKKLSEAVPKGEYYRFFEHWNDMTQRLVFLIAMVIYLEAGFLVERNTVADILGLAHSQSEGFHLDLESYLMGILRMVTELSRFAVNAVSQGDYSSVLNMQQFVADLSAGFRLLNLKNDILRRKFDALKYAVKKIEEIIYDLKIRGLLKPIEETAIAQ